MTKEQYLLWVAPRIVLDSLGRNLLPSPRISQACFEPDYGESELAIKANNLFGVKDNDQWNGPVYNKDSGEFYEGVGYDGKISGFQVYDSWDDSIYWQGWYLENRSVSLKYHPEIKHYAELVGNRDYRDCARILQEKGYGTSPEYAKRVIDYIERHDLTKYDSMTREEAEAMIRAESGEKKMIINVHAGHNPAGKVACGAVGLINESTENRNVAAEVIAQLRGLGHTVYDCTVNDGVNASDVLKKIVAKCNAHDVDLDVSIHFNAGAADPKGNGKTTGTESYIYSDSSKAKPYAQEIARNIAALGYKLRDDAVKDDVKNASYLYVLKNTKAPAVLVECCFVDDADDVGLYSVHSMASAIVKGIAGKTYEPVERPKEEVPEVPTKKALYRVYEQKGAFSVKENAERMKENLMKAGSNAIIVES